MLSPERWLELYHNGANGWKPELVRTFPSASLPPFCVGRFGNLRTGFGGSLRALASKKTSIAAGSSNKDPSCLPALPWSILAWASGSWRSWKVRPGLSFVGGNGLGTALLGIGLLLSLAAVAHLVMAKSGKSPKRQIVIGVSCGLLTVAVMVAMRDLLRNFALAPYFSPNQLPVAPQWNIIGLFLILFVGGLGTLCHASQGRDRIQAPGNSPETPVDPELAHGKVVSRIA